MIASDISSPIIGASIIPLPDDPRATQRLLNSILPHIGSEFGVVSTSPAQDLRTFAARRDGMMPVSLVAASSRNSRVDLVSLVVASDRGKWQMISPRRLWLMYILS